MKKVIIASKRPSIRELDDLCREVVRVRDKGCVRCGREAPYKLDWAHFYSRAIKAVRWDLDNSALLCFNCHGNFAHKQPREFSEFWRERLGDKAFDALMLRRNVSKVDRQLVKIYLVQKLREVKDDI